MARSWLEIERIQELWDEQKWNRERLIEWENQAPQHKDSIIHPLYELNEALEDKMRDLYYYAKTTAHIRRDMPDGETSVILDERLPKEYAAYDTLNEALSNLRGEVTALKDCLDDPLGFSQKLQSRLDAAHKRNKGLDRVLKDLRVEHEELENILWSQGELEDQIQVLGSSVEEKDKEIARISQQTNELRYPRSPEKITEIVNSTDNLTISDKSNTIGKLEKEKSDLSEQLQRAIRERDDEHQKWLTAREDKEIMREVFKSNEYTREQLIEENKALYEQVAGLKAQRQPASPYAHTAGRSPSVGSLQPSRSSMTQVHREQAATNPFAGSNVPRTPVRQSSSSFGNRNFSSNTPARNHRRISSASSLSRSRPNLTSTQERVIATVQHLRDDQLERLESDGAFESISIKVPGHGHHWVKGHWRRNRGTTFYESDEEV